MNGKWMSRKFWLAVGLLAIATALLLLGKIDQAVWASIAGGNVVQYSIANVSQKRGTHER